MKRIILLALVAMATALSASAQIAPAKYKDINKEYNYKAYQKSEIDPYKPGLSALASFIVPGLGQALSGEIVRGLCFFGGSVVCSAVIRSASNTYSSLAITDQDGTITGFTDEEKAGQCAVIMFGTLACDIALSIWSCIDASHVAKVKNMYYQDQYGKLGSLEASFQPYFALDTKTPGTAYQPVGGMTFRLAF